MKVDIDFGDCVSAYAEEQKKSYGYSTENIKAPMLVLLDAARNYEDAAGIVFDLLESIPEGFRKNVMTDRGYQKISEES